jgi:hypothetical protein
MNSIKEYTSTLLDQVNLEITHPRYPSPVILRLSIDAITRLPIFYFEAVQNCGNDDSSDTNESYSEYSEADEREADEREADERKADEREADEREADEREADERKADERKADEREADERKADERKADERKADEREADEREADERKADERKADEREADEREADEHNDTHSDENKNDRTTAPHDPISNLQKPSNNKKFAPKNKNIEPSQQLVVVPHFVKYNDAWLYKTNDGIYVKFTSDKYKSMAEEDVSAHAKKMIINTFGEEYATNKKYLSMQERYKFHFTNPTN